MKHDLLLNRAIRLARSRNYDTALRILEGEETQYYRSFRYYYFMAVVSLHTSNFGGALKYFRMAREIKMNDPRVLLGLAALYMNRGETDKAVDIYLDIKEKDPKNKIAKKALLIIRKYSEPEAFFEWRDSGKLPQLYPPMPSPDFSLKRFVITCISIAAVLVLCAGIFVRLNMLPNIIQLNRQGTRSTAEFVLSAEERAAPVQLAGVYRFIFTSSQAVDTYDRALRLFTAHRDEAARVELNRILESNASEGVKNRARLLMDFLEVPGFHNFRRSDNFSFAQVVSEPVLYRGVHVIWRGMATNIEVQDDLTSFDFLIGYDIRRTLEGIAPVVFDRAVAVSNERPLEVLGRITPIGPGERAIRLEGISIHQPMRFP